MSEQLTTADLAGSTTTRARATEPPVGTRDPMLNDRDTDLRSDSTTQVNSVATDSTPASTLPRTSQIANPAATDGPTSSASSAEPMFPAGEVDGFRTRWTEVQTGFVDEPRNAVEQADGLVAEMMKRLAQVFADERGKLEEQWSRGDDISTEDLRQALRRYRSFMDRLLSV